LSGQKPIAPKIFYSMATDDENKPSWTSQQVLFITCAGGVLITAGGLYLTIIKSNSTSWTGPDEVGNPGRMQSINGPSTLIIG
jgi:hypothetical protein